jgi:hypothetical protein
MNKDAIIYELLDKSVLILAAGYFYMGKLKSFDADTIKLADAQIIYDINNFDKSALKSEYVDKLPGKHWMIERSSIESLGEF